MTVEYPKDWYEHRITLEGDLEVGAGVPPGKLERSSGNLKFNPIDTRIAFGKFVAMWRRNQGWNATRLAEEAGLDPEEVLEIEYDPNCEPEPEAVYKLAQVFGISPKPLLELAGLTELRTPMLRERAVRFAARSESVAALTEHEREAFESFVSALTEMT